jgi:hypothetical protein
MRIYIVSVILSPRALHLQVRDEERVTRLGRDPAGSKLPQKRGPRTVTGVVGPDKVPPHNFSRDAIEEAIDVEGFQL